MIPCGNNVQQIMSVWLFDSSNAGKTGRSGNFTTQLVNASRANSAVAVTVTEVDATNEPGLYDVKFTPNATGRWTLHAYDATYAPRGFTEDFYVYAADAFALVNTALPNVAFAAAGGLPTVGTGANQIDVDASGRVNLGKILGTAVATPATAGVLDVNVKNWGNTVVALVGGLPSVAATTIANAAIAAATFAANALDAVWSTVSRTITGGTIGTYTGNTPQTGDSFARLGAPAGSTISADIAAKPTAAQIETQVLDTASGLETGKTVRQGLKYVAAAAAGTSSGMTSSGGTAIFNAIGNDSTPRISAPLDSNGNRTAVTLS